MILPTLVCHQPQGLLSGKHPMLPPETLHTPIAFVFDTPQDILSTQHPMAPSRTPSQRLDAGPAYPYTRLPVSNFQVLLVFSGSGRHSILRWTRRFWILTPHLACDVRLVLDPQNSGHAMIVPRVLFESGVHWLPPG